MVFSLTPGTTNPSILREDAFAWIGAQLSHGGKNGRVVGSWCLINLLATIGMFSTMGHVRYEFPCELL